MTKYQIARIKEGNEGFGVINNENEYYNKNHFDGISFNNFIFNKENADLMTIIEAHKIAYDLNNK